MAYELTINLPWLPKLPNQMLYKSWWLVKKEKDRWRAAIQCHVGKWQCPAEPVKRAHLTLIRRSSAQCDPDALVGSFKYVIDSLVFNGIIAGDTSDHIEISASWEKARPKYGSIQVEVREVCDS